MFVLAVRSHNIIDGTPRQKLRFAILAPIQNFGTATTLIH